MHDIQVLKDIHKTLKKSIRIDAVAVHGDLEVWESKFGGAPYVPKNMEYPRDKNGKTLYLLAQINFADVPPLEHFPKDGILQFYISDSSDYGCWNENYQVIYIPHTTNYENQSDLSFLGAPLDFPLGYVHSLTFSHSTKPISTYSPSFDKTFAKYIEQGNEELSFYDIYHSLIDHYNSHHIGGWASFVQDPPAFMEDENNYEVLLEIGYGYHITFGDGGIATFLINRADLKKLDFSKVIFWWNGY